MMSDVTCLGSNSTMQAPQTLICSKAEIDLINGLVLQLHLFCLLWDNVSVLLSDILSLAATYGCVGHRIPKTVNLS